MRVMTDSLLNFYLNVFKRFAFECPIRDISDEFYRALIHYQVSMV